MLKIRRSRNNLVFNKGISILGEDGLNIETEPRCRPVKYYMQSVCDCNSELRSNLCHRKWMPISRNQPSRVIELSSHNGPAFSLVLTEREIQKTSDNRYLIQLINVPHRCLTTWCTKNVNTSLWSGVTIKITHWTYHLISICTELFLWRSVTIIFALHAG